MSRPAALPWLLAAPFPAFAVGAFVASRHGVPPSAFAPNVVAAALGASIFFAARRARFEVLVIVALLALGATLAFPAEEGVKRWILLGPARINVGTAILPLLLGGLTDAKRAPFVAATAALLYALQPDAGQAVALAGGAFVLLGRAPSRRGAITCAIALAGSIVAWLRPDPLAPVAHVEDVLRLARADGMPTALAAYAALALATATLAAGPSRDVACAVAAAFAVPVVVSELRPSPVPLLGVGAGPVLGWYAALLVSSSPHPARREAERNAAPPFETERNR